MDKEQALAIARAFLALLRDQGYSVKLAFLFGSSARGEASPDSDIDVAVVLEGITDSFETQVELMKLRRKVDLRIEPHPFAFEDEASGFLAEVRRTGVRVA